MKKARLSFDQRALISSSKCLAFRQQAASPNQLRLILIRLRERYCDICSKSFHFCIYYKFVLSFVFYSIFIKKFNKKSFFFVLREGLEPSHLAALAPEASVSTIPPPKHMFIICARKGIRTLTPLRHHPLKMACLPISPSALVLFSKDSDYF